MGILPEEFPVVLTVFLAFGAWRMSRHHVLARQAAAIETLGAATVLCVDKTGTLTENRMAVRRCRAEEAISMTASPADATPLPGHGRRRGALRRAGERGGAVRSDGESDRRLRRCKRLPRSH